MLDSMVLVVKVVCGRLGRRLGALWTCLRSRGRMEQRSEPRRPRVDGPRHAKVEAVDVGRVRIGAQDAR